MSDFEDVGAVSDVAEGEMHGVTLHDGEPVCVFNYRGSIGAVGNLCTHSAFLISDGVLHGDGTLECVWHGARFDCRTGAVRRQPAVDPLPVYEVRTDQGRVLVGPRTNAITEQPQ
ncbi:MAG: Rieske 2Fe-2S domain-containing protein [Gemmatimonadaceae bacterium]